MSKKGDESFYYRSSHTDASFCDFGNLTLHGCDVRLLELSMCKLG